MRINIGSLLAFAALGLDATDVRSVDPRVKPLKERPEFLGPVGATDDQRKPLLTGRRGKKTRKQRKVQHD